MNARTKTRLAIWVMTMYCLAQIILGAYLSVEVIPEGYGGAQLLAAFVLFISDFAMAVTLGDQIEEWNK